MAQIDLRNALVEIIDGYALVGSVNEPRRVRGGRSHHRDLRHDGRHPERFDIQDRG
jgi:hypothetical protein